MSNKASDTLAIARSLKAAGVEAEKADAFVEAVARSTGKFVTVEHFDAAVEKLDTRMGGLDSRMDGLEARIDAVRTELLTRMDGLEVRIDAVRTELQAGIDAVRTELQASIDTNCVELQASIHAVRTETKADIARSLAIMVSVNIAAITLMTAILGFLMMDGATV